jgi:hypothetical protein
LPRGRGLDFRRGVSPLLDTPNSISLTRGRGRYIQEGYALLNTCTSKTKEVVISIIRGALAPLQHPVSLISLERRGGQNLKRGG